MKMSSMIRAKSGREWRMRVKATKQWRRTLQIVVLGEEDQSKEAALPPSQNRNEAIDAAEVVQATRAVYPIYQESFNLITLTAIGRRELGRKDRVKTGSYPAQVRLVATRSCATVA
jgi:hypothetical protein